MSFLLRSHNSGIVSSLKQRTHRLVRRVFCSAVLITTVGVATSSAQADFSARGPYPTTTYNATGYTVFHPTTLGANGLKHPVIAWGNGTGATPSAYTGLLNHLASYGFVVVAANTTSAGNGAAMSGGIDLILAENTRMGSRFLGKIDTTSIGVSGHSQGAIGAVNVAINDSRVSAALPIQGLKLNRGAIDIPVFAIAGSADFIIRASSVRAIFTGATGPAVYGVLQGATHFAPIGAQPNAEIRHYATAWFRLHLFHETALRNQFFVAGSGISADRQWRAEFKNADL